MSDTQWDEWFDQQQRNGMVVISRDEWAAKLEEAEHIGYEKGRADAFDEMEANQ